MKQNIVEEIEAKIQEAVFEKAEMEKHARMVVGEAGNNTGMSIVDRGVKIAKIEGKIQAFMEAKAIMDYVRVNV